MKNMRINKVSFTDKTTDQYSVIIDVRTPLEYKEDHIPESSNYPVLTNKQRHEIGIKYKENSFLAKKIGAQLISQNIAKILGKNIF
jgi:tRNA 2-selenouridine synthase